MEKEYNEKYLTADIDAYSIDYKKYSKIDVKRGLRNIDGSGVLAGLTKVCEIHGYMVSEGEKIPDEGKLSFRGYDVNDLVSVCGENGRFSYEEVSFLLLMGHLPNRNEFDGYKEYIAKESYLPNNFAEDMILKSPSRDIMNKLARSVLTLYSYDDNADDTSVENVLRQSVSLIAKLPINPEFAKLCDKGDIEKFNGEHLNAVLDKIFSL